MIVVLSYDAPHRKTQDVLFKLKARGYENVTVLASPWVKRKVHKPIYKQRPGTYLNVPLEDMCKNLGYHTQVMEIADFTSFLNRENVEHILVGGAGILPDELVNNHQIINSHPGYLPFTRGLDSFKWAIYYNQTVGVTAHYIDTDTDEGLLIERKEVPLYYEDSFHSFAYRQYELEVELLVNSIEKVKEIETFDSLKNFGADVHRRMPHHIEIKMMEKFEERRKNADSWATKA